MRRLLCVFLLIWFPLQMSWAAVASYCQHETSPQASHLGHHQHAHQDSIDGKGQNGSSKNDQGSTKQSSIDNDCATCHFSAAPPVCEAHEPVLKSHKTWVSLAQRGHATHIPKGLERPDIRLAA